jgi:hypothetical protein
VNWLEITPVEVALRALKFFFSSSNKKKVRGGGSA